MKFSDLFTLSPVNKMAGLVTSQIGCVEVDRDLTKKEIVLILDRLKRKHALLKRIIKVENHSQHVNLMNKFKSGRRQYRAQMEPRSFFEYVLVGRQIESLCRELAEMRKARRFVYELETQEAA